jgi:heme exporter protein D
VSQILAALAFAALAAPGLDQRTTRDLAGLMLATVLGLTYIDFMAVLVIWYGDLPNKVGWFVVRAFAPWTWLAFAAFVFVSVLPVLALLLERVRTSRAALRAVGVSILLGLAFYDGYLLAPVYGLGSLATAVLAFAVLGSALFLLAGVNWLALAARWRPA